MKIRVKFSKQGASKFIGHLDIMRFFQKANRRAGVDIKYSEGYSPHQIISFAAPLGVGILSRAEYFDMTVNSTLSSAEMIEKINAALNEEVFITGYRKLPDDAKNCMSIIAAADYTVYLGDDTSDNGEFKGAVRDMGRLINDFMSLSSVYVQKKTKKSEKVVDIRPMIYELKYVGDNKIFMKVAQGSVSNLKPEIVIAALLDFAVKGSREDGSLYADTCLANIYDMAVLGIVYERTEMYADAEDKDMSFVSLDSFGEEIYPESR